MTDVIKAELGTDLYEELSARLRTELGFQERHTEIKNPLFIQALFENAKERGTTCQSLEKIVKMIMEKRYGA